MSFHYSFISVTLESYIKFCQVDALLSMSSQDHFTLRSQEDRRLIPMTVG